MISERRGCPPNLEDSDGLSVAADPELVAQGWVRRFLADSVRAQEAFDLYTSLGYEVKAQKLAPADFNEMCGDCRSEACRSYVLIYTRMRVPSQEG